MKQCTKCGRLLALSEFTAKKDIKSGLSAACRDCQLHQGRAYYRRNKAKVNDRIRKYREANPERAREIQLAATRRYNERNRETRNQQSREYYQAHKEESAAYAQLDYDRNRDRYLAYSREWKRNNPELAKHHNELRRARLRGNAPGIEFIDRNAIVERYGSRCYLCDCELSPATLTLDHVIPLARGGVHAEHNVRPCCKPCNARKKHRLWNELPEKYADMAERIRREIP